MGTRYGLIYPWLVDAADIIEGPKLAIEHGRMAVPRGPGLGVTLDRDRLAHAHETYNRSGMRRRDDASLMRKLEPGWTGGLLYAGSLRISDDRAPAFIEQDRVFARCCRIATGPGQIPSGVGR